MNKKNKHQEPGPEGEPGVSPDEGVSEGALRNPAQASEQEAAVGGFAQDIEKLAAELGMTIESNYECCIF